jgi:hypothetical protein
MGREDEIKLIAYNIWEEEGYPNGRDYEHWLKAETIWEQRQKQAAATKVSQRESQTTFKKSAKAPITREKSRGT